MRGSKMTPDNERDNDRENAKIEKFGFVKYLKDYTSKTSLHGMQYLGEDRRHPIERIWWFVMITLSFITCSYLIMQVWNKWEQSPVIVSFADTSTPVWKIPFPAVTICPELKVRQRAVNITDYYDRYPNLTKEELFRFEAASLACDKRILSEGNYTASKSAIKLVYSISQTADDIFYKCYWRQESGECNFIFYETTTEEGQCFTFNRLSKEEFWRSENMPHDNFDNSTFPSSAYWDLDNGYDPSLTEFEVFPYRAAGSGTEAGLTIHLKTFQDDIDYSCKRSTDGFKVALHMPVEVSRISQNFFKVPFESEVFASISPSILATSENLKTYSPEKRMCYFKEERMLKYFQIYTQKNCQVECISNYTMFSCGCVEYFMPHDDSTPICSAAGRNCSVTAQDELLTRGLGLEDDYKERENSTFYQEKLYLATNCRCLPSCTSISYQVEVSQNAYFWKKSVKKHKKDQITGWTGSRLRLFYRDSQFLTTKRYELYGQIDFLANCGGLLGLCLGFSVLSLIEIVYFFTMRFIFKLRNNNNNARENN